MHLPSDFAWRRSLAINDGNEFWGTFSDFQRLQPKQVVRSAAIEHDIDFDYEAPLIINGLVGWFVVNLQKLG